MNLRSPLSRARSAGVTLLEMIVSATLLAVIMLGLLMMFNQTQKALHVANTQTDVFENGRAAIEFIVRDLAEMADLGHTNITNFSIVTSASAVPNLPLPGTNRPFELLFSEPFWLNRQNDDWRGLGYYVSEDLAGGRANTGVGTLYRFSGDARRDRAAQLLDAYNSDLAPAVASNLGLRTNRIGDGIVHFALSTVYVTNVGSVTNPIVDFVVDGDGTGARPAAYPKIWSETANGLSNFVHVALPAYVDVEIGVLEPNALKQFQSIRDVNLASAQSFLTNHSGQVHFFRERVPIRNFVNPFRLHEVP